MRFPRLFLFIWLVLLIASPSSGTLLVITDPDATSTLDPIFNGATNEEFDPIKVFSPTVIEFLKTPL